MCDHRGLCWFPLPSVMYVYCILCMETVWLLDGVSWLWFHFVTYITTCMRDWPYFAQHNTVGVKNGNSFGCVFIVHTTDKLNMCNVLHSLEFKQHLIMTPFVFTDAYWFCSCFLLVRCTVLVQYYGNQTGTLF